MLSIATSGFAAETELTESDVKAAYLYNFSLFTKWSMSEKSDGSDPLEFCVIGDSIIASALRNALAKQAGKRTVSVREPTLQESMSRCRILYLGGAVPPSNSMLRRSDLAHSLIVSNFPEVGIIWFVISDSRVRFVVDLSHSDAAGIQFSAKLLKAAQEVVGGDSETVASHNEEHP